MSVTELAAILAMDLTNRETTACVVDASGAMIATGPPEEGPLAPFLPAEQYRNALEGHPHTTSLVTVDSRKVLAVLIPPLAWLPNPPAIVELATDVTRELRLLWRLVALLIGGTLLVAWAELFVDTVIGDGLGVLALAGIPLIIWLASLVIAPRRSEQSVVRADSLVPAVTARTDFTAVMRRVEAAFLAKQASEQRMRRFITDASHELRTPLTSIGGAADVLIRGAKDDPELVAHLATVVRAQTDRLSRLVEDLLTLARFDSGLAVETTEVDLAQMLVEHGEELALAAPDRQITLENAPGAIVDGNGDRLRQVLSNLTSNAVRYTKPGGSIAVRLALVGQSAVIAVSDDGSGISGMDLPHIFERFYRGDPARGGGGYGLGLAIVREIVEAHHGSVAASSDPGRPTEVVVTLPLAVPNNDQPISDRNDDARDPSARNHQEQAAGR